MNHQLAFISYRREDEGAAARFIKAELERYFGAEQIFMDVDDIRIADNWQTIIHRHLQQATILIVIIGKNWLKIQDEYFRRRIDNASDWVRQEIEAALQRDIPLLPFLLGAPLPPKEALPEAIKELTASQFLSLSAANWRNDMAKLISLLKEKGFAERSEELKFPTPKKDMLFPLHLTYSQIEEELQPFTGWKIIEYYSREKVPKPGMAIEKIYRFPSFEKAIAFMSFVSQHISVIQHHPEWENIWKNLRVRLSTWDTGHNVTSLDIALARYMEEQFAGFST